MFYFFFLQWIDFVQPTTVTLTKTQFEGIYCKCPPNIMYRVQHNRTLALTIWSLGAKLARLARVELSNL